MSNTNFYVFTHEYSSQFVIYMGRYGSVNSQERKNKKLSKPSMEGMPYHFFNEFTVATIMKSRYIDVCQSCSICSEMSQKSKTAKTFKGESISCFDKNQKVC